MTSSYLSSGTRLKGAEVFFFRIDLLPLRPFILCNISVVYKEEIKLPLNIILSESIFEPESNHSYSIPQPMFFIYCKYHSLVHVHYKILTTLLTLRDLESFSKRTNKFCWNSSWFLVSLS